MFWVPGLCGSISWVRPLLGISSEDLALLFNLLWGSGKPNSPRSLTPEEQKVIAQVQGALSAQRAHRYQAPSLPFLLAVLGQVPHCHGLIFQWDADLKDPLLVLEWVFLHARPNKTVTAPQEATAAVIGKGRTHLCSLAGCDFTFPNHWAPPRSWNFCSKIVTTSS